MEDREVQTNAREPIIYRVLRPNTTNMQRRNLIYDQNKRTYNLINSSAHKSELLNQRRFVIYDKE